MVVRKQIIKGYGSMSSVKQQSKGCGITIIWSQDKVGGMPFRSVLTRPNSVNDWPYVKRQYFE